jgi:predicted deacetylase
VQRSLVVSIHDVAPATQPRVERILAQLRDAGVPHCSLLVVPDYHRRGRSLGETGFLDWLQELGSEGHEIVVHGFYHERKRREGETLRERLVTHVYTADEGEFYDLAYDEALRLLREARGEFAAHGFDPVGFIAPAWLLGAEARRAVIEAGFRYTTRLGGVQDLVGGGEFASQSLVYSVRNRWRRSTSLLWNWLLFQRLTRNRLLRLGIHPPDIEHPSIWQQIRAFIRKALRDREPTTYEAWLDSKLNLRPQSGAIA